jgi:lantibiotic modifying enzyme
VAAKCSTVAATCSTVAASCSDAPAIDNESLCHGTLGNLDALMHASEAFHGERFWADMVQRQLSELDAEIAARGPRCARPNYVTVPGLMTGLAGIGYASLRLANPSAFPSVLTLAFPQRRGAATQNY